MTAFTFFNFSYSLVATFVASLSFSFFLPLNLPTCSLQALGKRWKMVLPFANFQAVSLNFLSNLSRRNRCRSVNIFHENDLTLQNWQKTVTVLFILGNTNIRDMNVYLTFWSKSKECYIHHTYITFIYPWIFRVAYAANISEHLTIIWEIDHYTGNIVPYSIWQVRGFFKVPC